MSASRADERVACIGCDSHHVERLGPLPVFTPDLLGTPRAGQATFGFLYACRRCTLRFRWPQPTPEQLERYYLSQGVADRWTYSGERPVWRALRRAVARVPERAILDVGCFRGDLLEYLGPAWRRYGVEPSADASRVARERGIEIVGASVEELASDGLRFGAVSLVWT